MRETRTNDGATILNNLELTNSRFSFTTGKKNKEGVNPLISLMYSKENEALFI
jgi:hypothetical protein